MCVNLGFLSIVVARAWSPFRRCRCRMGHLARWKAPVCRFRTTYILQLNFCSLAPRISFLRYVPWCGIWRFQLTLLPRTAASLLGFNRIEFLPQLQSTSCTYHCSGTTESRISRARLLPCHTVLQFHSSYARSQKSDNHPSDIFICNSRFGRLQSRNWRWFQECSFVEPSSWKVRLLQGQIPQLVFGYR